MAVVSESADMQDGDIKAMPLKHEIEVCQLSHAAIRNPTTIRLQSKRDAEDLIIALHIAIAKTWPS